MLPRLVQLGGSESCRTSFGNIDPVLQVISRMFKVTFGAGETVLEQDSLPTDDDCLYMLDTGEVDIVIAGSGEAANTNQEERKVLLHFL